MQEKNEQNLLSPFGFPRNHIIDFTVLVNTKPVTITLTEFESQCASYQLVKTIRSYRITDDTFIKNFVFRPMGLKKKKKQMDLKTKVSLHVISIDELGFRFHALLNCENTSEHKAQMTTLLPYLLCIFMHIYQIEELLPPTSGEQKFIYGLKCKYYHMLFVFYTSIEKCDSNFKFDKKIISLLRKHINKLIYSEKKLAVFPELIDDLTSAELIVLEEKLKRYWDWISKYEEKQNKI